MTALARYGQARLTALILARAGLERNAEGGGAASHRAAS